MEANKRSLDKLLSPSIRLVAPLFQRPYVWNRDSNWVPLWQSIHEVAERRLQKGTVSPHFLGAVVLNQLSSAAGDTDTREIIDGQQRLTTLQVLISVLRDIARQHAVGNYSDLFSQWVKNLLADDARPDDEFKVWPTNADREHFRTVMTAQSPFALYHTYIHDIPPTATPQGFGPDDDPMVRRYLLLRAAGGEVEGSLPYEDLTLAQRKEVDPHIHALKSISVLLPNAYLYFYAVVIGWLGDPGDSTFKNRMQALYQTIKQDLVLVVIDLDDKDDAQQIFETMNALGAPLLPADLVKNFLFRIADVNGLPVDQLYAKHWAIFDDQKQGWREEVRQGRLKRPRIDLFLQHYLTLMTGEDVLVTELFSTYRKWALAKREPVDTRVVHFRRYANIYRRFESFPEDSREALFFARMAQLDTTTVFSLMLEVFSRHTAPGADQEIRAIMDSLESFLVRRAVCGLSPKNYNQLFRRLVRQLMANDDFSAAAIRQFLLKQTADTAVWPNDKDLHKAWMSRPLYKVQVQQRTRMILEALERQLHNSRTSTHKITGTVSIEHLMPQKWETHWKLASGGNTDDVRSLRNNLIHTIGNLTIVTKSLNPTLSNGPWAKKLPEIRKRNALCLNLNLPEHWDEAAIKQRGADLFNAALAIWPHPVAASSGDSSNGVASSASITPGSTVREVAAPDSMATTTAEASGTSTKAPVARRPIGKSRTRTRR